MPDIEQFSQVASAIESLAVATAVVFGGIWTLYTFGRLGTTKRAQSELAELQQKLSRTAQLNIDMRGWHVPGANEGEYLLLAQAVIENVGARRTNLQFPEDRRPFHAMLIDAAGTGDLRLGSVLSSGIPYGDGRAEFSQRAVVGPGARVTLPAAFLVTQPGLYLVSFSATPSVDVQQSLHEEGVPQPNQAQWTGRCYVMVAPGDDAATDESQRAPQSRQAIASGADPASQPPGSADRGT